MPPSPPADSLQASEAIRQARWQLPYQPIGVPDNVSRIIGNLRLRHSREINAVAFSPDGLKLATASQRRHRQNLGPRQRTRTA